MPASIVFSEEFDHCFGHASGRGGILSGDEISIGHDLFLEVWGADVLGAAFFKFGGEKKRNYFG